MTCVKLYLTLTKPGIIIGNLITALGGFALASRGSMDGQLLLITLSGLAFVIASACVFNNYFDRSIDQKMSRTQNRPLAQGLISPFHALIYAFFLGAIGFLTLALFTNPYTTFAATAGFVGYIVLYGFSKYHTSYGTLIGSLAGATPPLIGYTAVNPSLDSGALLLFLILALWQMPHFFAITLYRLDDYAAAALPVLPLRKGIRATKIQMLFYTLAFTFITPLLTPLGYTGTAYFIVSSLLGILWLALSFSGFKAQNEKRWARKMFLFSLITVTLLCLMMSIDNI